MSSDTSLKDFITIKEAARMSGRTRQFFYIHFKKKSEEFKGCFKREDLGNNRTRVLIKRSCIKVVREKVDEDNPAHKKLLSAFNSLYGRLYDIIEVSEVSGGRLSAPGEKLLANIEEVDKIIIELVINKIIEGKLILHGENKTKVAVREGVRSFRFRFLDHTSIIVDTMRDLVEELEG